MSNGPFLYYIPGVQVASPKLISDLGLDYTIAGRNGGAGVVGPDGASGVILTSDKTVAGHFPESQHWKPAPRGDRDSPPFWIGFNKDNPPTPESLARSEQLESKPITLADGSVWNVPILRHWHPSESSEFPAIWSTPLPCMVDIDRYGGACDGLVVREYRDLFDLGLQVIAQMANRGIGSLTGSQLMGFAADVLGMNYQVSLLELSSSVLDILSTTAAMNIVFIAVGWESYEEAVKNWAGRQERPVTNSDSGSEQQTQGNTIPTDPVPAS